MTIESTGQSNSEPTAGQDGTLQPEGQPANQPVEGTTLEEGQPPVDGSTEQGGEPIIKIGEELPDGMTPEQLLTSYKELQRTFGTKSEEMKSLEGQLAPFGGIEQIVNSLTYLTNSDSFKDWAKTEQQRATLGDNYGLSEDGKIDPETQKAIDIVKRIVDQRVDSAMKSQVEPLADSYKQRLLSENMKTMDGKYGNEWRELQDEMASLADNLPETIQDNPTLGDLEDLYWKALRSSGKIESMQAKMYEKNLATKKSQSQEKPKSSAGTIQQKRATTMMQAFQMAKEQHANS